ncbi:MAG: MgtC/SapB family protein, partial [Gemmatimonadales bacterium]
MLLLNPLVTNLAVALGVGLLIGAERERRKGHGDTRAPAGIRTFTIVALLGAISFEIGGGLLLAVATVGVAALSAVAYSRARGPDPGLTTEAALVFTVVLGGFAMVEPAVAAGLSVIVATLLFARSKVHHFVRSVVTEDELHDLLLLAAGALVILPLAPDRYLGPFEALNPRVVWRLVLLMMSIGGLGHIAIRLFGPKIGLPLAGLASGFASSSATIGSMGARAKEHPALLRAAVAAAVLSTVSTVILTAIVLWALDPRVLAAMAWSLGLAGVGAVGYGLVFTRRAIHAPLPGDYVHGRAFRLRTALIFAAALSLVAVVVAGLNQWLGAAGT